MTVENIEIISEIFHSTYDTLPFNKTNSALKFINANAEILNNFFQNTTPTSFNCASASE